MKLFSLFKSVRISPKYLGLCIFLWLLMLGTFCVTGIGTESYRFFLQFRRYFPASLAVTVAMYMWKKNHLSIRGLFPDILIFLFWMFTYNVTSYIANKDITTNLNNHMDIAFAGYVFAFLVFAKNLLSYSRRFRGIIHSLSALTEVCLMVIPIASILYFWNYGSAITSPAAIALLQTNPNEAKEYLMQNIGYGGIVALILLLVGMIISFYRMNSLIDIPSENIFAHKRQLILTGVLLLAVGAYVPKSFLSTGVMNSMLEAGSYLKNARQFQNYHKNHLADLSVQLPQKTFSKPSTIIVIVGESYGRNFMSAYGYDENNTTPWLRQVTDTDSSYFIKYDHAYSSYGSTMQSLERALTEKNQYNDKEFNSSFSIIDLAKKAGYKTYWFSNQGIRNSTDTPVQLVAKTSDISYWIEEEEPSLHRIMYDGDLIKCLNQINPNENNFVVIHVMGCHELTLHRFPEDRTQFGEPGVYDMVRNYEDAMAYSDWVWKQVFEYGRDKLNLQAMLIFSDHGANPYRKRTADDIPFINVRIPLIFYLSDEYQALYPQTTQELRNHKEQYFSNDLIYEAVGGLLNLKSSHLPQENNIGSPEYRFTRDTIKTDLGRKWVKDDIHEDRIE